ncbi:hypothetical protein MTO96_024647 [Rhipicephalus appendiculatus]
MGEQELEEVAVGTRVSCDGHYGVVRYCGPVVDTKGTWLGIEWDDPYRGKHNGCHKGVQYFPHKVERTLSVVDAVRDKYFSTLSDLEAPCLSEDKDVLLLQLTPNRNSSVCWAREDHRHTQPWWHRSPVSCHICRCCTSARTYWKYQKDPAALRDSFRSIRQMVLRGVGYSWDQALQCAEMWPWVEDLVLSLNGISVLRQPPDTLFQQLECLSLQDNPISSWETVCHLGHLPRLKSLSLADCDLTSVSFPETPPGQKTPLFTHLVTLNLHNNRLEEWVSIAELNKLASLEDLVVKGNPVTVREKRHITRSLIVSHLGKLQLLDRMAVTREERREAGIFYVNRFFPLWVQCGGTAEGGTPSPEFVREHPRFLSLLKTYGAPETVPDGKTPSFNKKVITVEIHAPQEPDRGPIRKRLPSSMSVEKLKALVMQLFPRKGSRFCLSLASQEEGKESVLDKERRDLSFYDITDGSRIYVRW